ncbi:TPA: helix-turn-helix transcriptional regulator [Clostridioides difficile]|uniref:helix-turn-helix transcriptional regulator n=1 Tax=Clostridioides difficile TaxID=1496 RepID=UPI0010BA71A3|nr:helix-turn-helix transcriptional regulator [Clostridioides difficile]UUV15627.1 helix-turn-helix domain-containing protein [Clostridioides difficile]VIF73785.1 transcriptional regulator [Clostridioides difficile]VIG64177.1 transcriptional regulator [Clostridioides difficile]HAU5070063.1 helix-turn-helix transcriptional regulator [Clostridioides difficile]HAU5231281.1 helix-turn-helix transcriptional regulator [Clostridioides difficile]
MGINLKIFRIKKGLKQQELADRVGISRYYLSNLETSKANNPSNDLMIKLSRALDATVEELFFSKEE